MVAPQKPEFATTYDFPLSGTELAYVIAVRLEVETKAQHDMTPRQRDADSYQQPFPTSQAGGESPKMEGMTMTCPHCKTGTHGVGEAPYQLCWHCYWNMKNAALKRWAKYHPK